MAVGVVIGGAFGKIVTGLVNFVISPFVGMFMQAGDLENWKTVVREKVVDAAGAEVTPEVAFMWGAWIQTIIDFLITAFCIFLVLRVIMKLKDKLEAKKIAEEKAKAEEEEKKAAEEKAKADAELEAVKARQTQLEESTLNQEKLLAEIKDILSKK